MVSSLQGGYVCMESSLLLLLKQINLVTTLATGEKIEGFLKSSNYCTNIYLLDICLWASYPALLDLGIIHFSVISTGKGCQEN